MKPKDASVPWQEELASPSHLPTQLTWYILSEGGDLTSLPGVRLPTFQPSLHRSLFRTATNSSWDCPSTPPPHPQGRIFTLPENSPPSRLSCGTDVWRGWWLWKGKRDNEEWKLFMVENQKPRVLNETPKPSSPRESSPGLSGAPACVAFAGASRLSPEATDRLFPETQTL